MMFEAIRPGEVRLRDLTAIHPAFARAGEVVNLAVLAADGKVARGHVTITTVSFGRGYCLMFVCPTCSRRSRILFANGETLRCSSCHPRRTRRQMEHHLQSWNRHGGKEEDEVLRVLTSGRKLTSAITRAVEVKALTLLRADVARLELLREKLKDLELAALAR